MIFRRFRFWALTASSVLTIGVVAASGAAAQEVPDSLRAAVDVAVSTVKPALVRVEVVSTYYSEGREQKYEASGSGVIIDKEGHVVTNHHVAGHATRLMCTMASKEEVPAEVVGCDPATDIALLKLIPKEPREFPFAAFGDSSLVKVGDHVLAMGSPMSLSQSVTLGIVSNAELVMPERMNRWGGVTQDGEDVGSLVRWLAHDAQIFGGNSGGPLVSIDGLVIGINEIRIGLGGAIPGNVARDVAAELLENGEVTRAWLGVAVQPRFKSANETTGVLVASVIDGSPAKTAGLESGDLLTRLGGEEVDIRFGEQLPGFNQMVAKLPIGKPLEAVVLRDGRELTLDITLEKREKALPDQFELKQWGVTVRDISMMMAKGMKRDNNKGVLVTSLRGGGPAGDAKPKVERRDIILKVNDTAIETVEDLRKITSEITEGEKEPVPTLVGFERKNEKYITVVKVGIKKLDDPGREVKKAWLPVETQVLTTDIAKQIGQPDLTGFRITQVFKGSTAEKAGLGIGDYILAVDDEKLTASAPEDYDKLREWIREYRVGDTVELAIGRGEERLTVPVELVRAPKLSREMKKYRDDSFEFTARNITFFDKAKEKWQDDQPGALIQEVVSGGWADIGRLYDGDLLVAVDDTPIADVDALETEMKKTADARPQTVVLTVLRGIHTVFLELEPMWDTPTNAEKE